MSGSKRERELARAKYERQQARRAMRVEKRRRNQKITAVVVVAVLVLAALVFVVVNRSGSSEPVAADTTASAEASAAPTASEESSADASGAPIEEPAILDCTPPGTPRANDVTFDAPGDAGNATSITFATNCGDIVVALDPAAPETIASEAFLAASGFYDNTSCHRLTTEGIFVLQCGDPAGNGTGGPGYTVPDENLPAAGDANYPAGTVAMANAGPGTSGSQFFIVYDDTTLPGDYTIWGTVTSGLDIVQEIASVGVAGGGADGAPQQPVFIESATVQSN